jgi:hypothetical protein
LKLTTPRQRGYFHDEKNRIYNVTFDVSNPGAVVLKNGAVMGGEQLKYTDWQVQNLDVSSRLGHDVCLIVLAADCTLGGHGGYAYVGGFGKTSPRPLATFLCPHRWLYSASAHWACSACVAKRNLR